MSRDLPYSNLGLMSGLATAYTSESVAGKFLRLAANVDGYDKFRGLGQIPGSTRLNTVVTDSIKSLNFFELIDLDRVFRRKLIAVTDAGGAPVVREFDLDAGTFGASLGAIDAGEQMFQAVMNNRIHCSSPNQNTGSQNLKTGGFKFDGSRVTNWGVQRPGAEITEVYDFEDFTDWTVENFIPETTLSNNTTIFRRGATSLQYQVDDAAQSRSLAVIPPTDFDPEGSGLAEVWVYMASGEIQNLPPQNSITIGITDNQPSVASVDQLGWLFLPGDFTPGWNLLQLDLDNPDQGNPVSVNVNAIDGIRIGIGQGIGFGGAINTRGDLTVLFDFFGVHALGEPRFATPLAPLGDEFVRKGEYRYRMSYTTEYGLESNAGPVSDTQQVPYTPATGSVTIGVGNAAAGDVVKIGPISYTFVAALSVPPVPNEVLAGASDLLSAAALNGAIIALASSAGTFHSIGTTRNPSVQSTLSLGTVNLQAGETAFEDQDGTDTNSPGTLGNDVIIEENGANITFVAMSGGTDGERIVIDEMPIPTDPSVVAKTLWRDFQGDGVYRVVNEFTDVDIVDYTDGAQTQGDLGPATLPFLGDPDIDNAPPVPFSSVEVFESRVFGVEAETGIVLYISEVSQPEAFPLLNQLVFEQPITALKTHSAGLLVYTSDNLFLVASDFSIALVNTQLGANGPQTVTRAKGLNIAVREKEVYVVRDLVDAWYISGPVQKNIDASWNSANLKDQIVIHDRNRFRFVFFTKDGSGDYTQLWVWQYGAQGFSQITGFSSSDGTDPQDLRVGSWFTMVLPGSGITPLCVAVGERSTDEPELWVGTDEGYIHHFQPGAWGDVPDWDTAAGPVAVTSIFQPQPTPLGGGESGRGEFRYAKWNGDFSGDPSLLFTFETLIDANATTVDSSAFTKVMADSDSAPIVPIPFVQKGEWGRLSVTNSTVGSSWRLSSLGFYYIPRSDFRGPREDG